MVWYIDPVYRTQTASSKPWKLLEALHAELQGYFEADKNFSPRNIARGQVSSQTTISNACNERDALYPWPSTPAYPPSASSISACTIPPRFQHITRVALVDSPLTFSSHLVKNNS